ncbi:MAG: UDP-N-acetylmuramate--L-alanine ligase [Clostridia bacterium]|nr:UDP-N-acetylmuramate--L-alanine ligase [Clostridia bacterium]
MELTNGCRVHFIGIGGISMSGLAHILIHDGCVISGSDRSDCTHINELRSLGADISIGHSAENIKFQDLVVYSAAIGKDNPELVRARELGIKVIDRAELMGMVMKNYTMPIAVSGTHGKTTTTGMLSQIFISAHKDPTITIGGDLDCIGGNIRIGAKDFFICEACEYHQSFLRFFPKMSLILNIEEDHLDYFKDLEHIISTFRALALLTPLDGYIIANADNENVRRALDGVERSVITFSVSGNADYSCGDVFTDADGCCEFTVLFKGTPIARPHLTVPGRHNMADALAAAAAAHTAGVEPHVIERALSLFCAAHRRFEHKGIYHGAKVIDDYAHHPTEIKATVDAAAKSEHNDIYLVFQPHTYTRTKTLFCDFADTLSNCGARVIVTDIYAAREKDTGIVSAKELAEHIDGSVYIKDFDEIVKLLRRTVKEGDIVLTVGAGDVYKIGEMLLENR